MTVSVHGKKGAKHTNPIDFMLDWDLEKKTELKKQSTEEMKEVLLSIVSAHNKQVNKNSTFPRLKPTKGI